LQVNMQSHAAYSVGLSRS